MSSEKLLSLVLAVGLLPGCFNEELPERNVTGAVVVPGDAVEDPRDIGMVYVGVYRDHDPEQFGYSYPTTAPVVGDNPIGDAQPYGGTSIGEYAYPCLRALKCEIITGRYSTIDDLLAKNEVLTEDGDPMSSEQFYDQCQWYYGWNSIDEFRFLGELDFAENDDGDWQADFLAWHTQVPTGSILWAFLDNDFTTCSTSQGGINKRRSDDGEFFREGTNYADVLNFPDKYVTAGDMVTGTPVEVLEDTVDGYILTLDEVID